MTAGGNEMIHFAEETTDALVARSMWQQPRLEQDDIALSTVSPVLFVLLTGAVGFV